jgi:hypothetical protein
MGLHKKAPSVTEGESCRKKNKTRRTEVTRYTRKCLIASAAAAVCLSASAVLWPAEEFQGRVLPESDRPGAYKAMRVKITVKSYSSRDEILKLLEILRDQGYEPFMRAFRDINVGTFRPIGGRGVKINLHAAHSVSTENGRQILLFTQRQTWDLDMQQRIDRRFPFMVIELNLDDKGNGEGKIYEQANIRLTAWGTMEMEAYNSPPRQLYDLQKVK